MALLVYIIHNFVYGDWSEAETERAHTVSYLLLKSICRELQKISIKKGDWLMRGWRGRAL